MITRLLKKRGNTMWTLEQALTNWEIAFQSGRYTAARAWWQIVQQRMSEGGGKVGKVG